MRAKISSPDLVQLPTEIWAQVSPEACDLCRKLLEKSPAKRLSATQALAHHWRGASGDLESSKVLEAQGFHEFPCDSIHFSEV